MKKLLFISIMFMSILFLSACGKENTKKVTCKMNSTGDILPEIVVTLDSNEKVSESEIHTVYKNEENAKSDFNSFKSIHGDNAVLDKNVIIVKNVHDENTVFGKQFSKTVGYTINEFQDFIGKDTYTCK